MEEEIKCNLCDKEFKYKDGLIAHNKAKHPELVPKEKKPVLNKNQKKYLIYFMIFSVVISGMIYGISQIKVFPPTDMEGHVEVNPVSHVLKEPMPIAVQKHMLEHADGEGPPGVVINYNCIDYNCESDLIERLEEFAGRYDYVYVAPFKGMDAKIALTRLGKIDVLESYDHEQIKNFIEGS